MNMTLIDFIAQMPNIDCGKLNPSDRFKVFEFIHLVTNAEKTGLDFWLGCESFTNECTKQMEFVNELVKNELLTFDYKHSIK